MLSKGLNEQNEHSIEGSAQLHSIIGESGANPLNEHAQGIPPIFLMIGG